MNYIHYTEEKDYTPEQAQKEYIEILSKAGRRAAYDLRHAADFIRDPDDKDFREMMYARASHWQVVFNPGNDGKNYRHHLHFVIENLRNRNEQLIRRCKEHGIDISDLTDDDIPF